VLVVVSPALRSLRRCQAIARRRDLSNQHQPIASLEATTVSTVEIPGANCC
jgi:hypothetical protein